MEVQAIKLEKAGCCDTVPANFLRYPAEYSAFKDLQETGIGKAFKYVFEKPGHEIWQDALCEKYA